MPLVDTGLIVRYYIDEAETGQGPSAVLDGSGVGADFDLTLSYEASLNYVEVGGNRGLENTDLVGEQRAEKAINDTSDKVRDNLVGSKTATLEVVVRVDDFNVGTGRLFAINIDTDNARLGWLGESTTEFQVYMNGTLMRTIDPGTVTAVWHAVINTAEPTANDRIKVYKAGILQSPTIDANPALNATISIGSGAKLFMFNRGDSVGRDRSMDGVLFYAALYSSALSAANVTTNDAILGADDDTPAAIAEIPAARPAWNYRLHA